MNRPLLQNSRLLIALLLAQGIAAGVHGQKPGTLLWKLHHPVASSPAIGTDGTVYIGSFGGWVSTTINKSISNWKRSPLGIMQDAHWRLGLMARFILELINLIKKTNSML